MLRPAALTVEHRTCLARLPGHRRNGHYSSLQAPAAKEIEDNDDLGSGIELHGEEVDRSIEHEERVLWPAGGRRISNP